MKRRNYTTYTETTIDLEREDGTFVEATVIGEVEPFIAGSRRGHPDNWEPDEGGSVSVTGATVDGEAIKLSANEEAECERALEDAGKQDAEDRAEDAAIARAEARWDR